MDPVILAKIQFFVTIGFHFIFVPVTIGLSWFIVYMYTKYMRTKDLYYKDMSWFWIKIMTISVAIGIPTGIVMEFQFGMNWSEYSRFVGELFGIPLALEVFFAFFLESVFLGVLIQGWNSTRVPEKLMWFSTILVAIGTTLSAFWILVANSWMHTPAGYAIEEGRVIMTDFWAAMLNFSTFPRFFHTFSACMITACFYMIGISAYYLLKKEHQKFAKESITMALIVGAIFSVLQGIIGHFHTIQVALTQPAKFAAQEGLFTTQSGAPLIIFGILTDTEVLFKIEIPLLLSILTFGDPNATITGLDAYPVNRPSVMLTFYPYHLMVFLGVFFILFTIGGILLFWRKGIDSDGILQKWYLRIAVLASPLPIITNELGWITTEVGRQPWIIQGILKTNDAISIVVPPEQVLFSLIMFILIFIVLFIAWLLVMIRIIRTGPIRKSEVKT